MKKIYVQPSMQKHELKIMHHLLQVSQIGEGSEGQNGDARAFSSDNASLFEDNSFE